MAQNYFGRFRKLIDEPALKNITTALLGVPGDAYSSVDRDKAVKMSTDSNYVLCNDGDDLQAFVDSVDDAPSGSTFDQNGVRKIRYTGGVRRPLSGVREYGYVQSGAVRLLDEVVAAEQLPVGQKSPKSGVTNSPGSIAYIKAGTGKIYRWRVIALVDGDGSQGSVVLIERM